MRKQFVFIFMLAFGTLNTAVAQDNAGQLYENAKKFTSQRDYSNAILLLNKAHKLAPDDIEITKDLALNYLFQKDNTKALETIKPTLDNENADDQCYQIAGTAYQSLGLFDDCYKLYKDGVKKFPSSGPLYNDYGEFLLNREDKSCILQWEKGIAQDPAYSKNYFNACRYYYESRDDVWCILNGEIFLNMEPLNSSTPEIKSILLECYKQLFTDITTVTKSDKARSKFTDAYIETMSKLSDIASNGIDAETLTMIRTRFILDWDQNYATKFPFRLFDLQRQLLQSGMFDAYNQWIFGTAQNLSAYQNWTVSHSAEYNEFSYFQKGRIFKIPKGQYYKAP